jgi:NADH-quinone oxidoreductase subunit N
VTTFLSQNVERLQAPEIDYGAVAPLLIVLGAACLSVLVEAFLPKATRWTAQVVLSFLTLLGAGLAVLIHAVVAEDTLEQGKLTLAGAIAIDRPVIFLWATLLVLGFGSMLLIADRSVEPGGAFVADASILPGQGGGVAKSSGSGGTAVRTRELTGRLGMQTEVFPLTLFSLGGMMVFVAANDLLTMFIALEVLSLPLYLMAGLARRRRLLSQEAAVKYFLLGAFASAFFLYGVALLYGFAGSVKLADIANATTATDRSDTLLYAGFGLLIVGLLFKASVGPFHAWTPDVYQGSPTPVTAFMAACTKVAAFGGILRVLYGAFERSSWEWSGVLWGVAIASMVIGAVLGLTQTDVKRMIAYSSVAHAGFLLVGAISLNEAGLSGTLFYLMTYGFTTIAAFGVVSLVRNADGEATHLSQWAGLAKRSPVAAAVFTFLLLALAGLPLTSGFVGKFAVFAAAVEADMTPLVVIALVASAVAAFFYLRVIVLMYFSEPAPDGPTVSVPGAFTAIAITLGAAVTLVLGVYPPDVLDWAGAGVFIF